MHVSIYDYIWHYYNKVNNISCDLNYEIFQIIRRLYNVYLLCNVFNGVIRDSIMGSRISRPKCSCSSIPDADVIKSVDDIIREMKSIASRISGSLPPPFDIHRRSAPLLTCSLYLSPANSLSLSPRCSRSHCPSIAFSLHRSLANSFSRTLSHSLARSLSFAS